MREYSCSISQQYNTTYRDGRDTKFYWISVDGTDFSIVKYWA